MSPKGAHGNAGRPWARPAFPVAARLAAAALLLVLSGCDRSLHRLLVHDYHSPIYAPTEVGLTLIYEDPSSLDAAKRFNERLQVRVTSAKDTAEGQMVLLTSTTLQGQQSSLCLVNKGGWTLLIDKRRTAILPEGFPDHTSSWDRPGAHIRVLGRAAAELPGLPLPADYDRIGVWVESESASGLSRTFYLSGIGEAESRVLRDGRWICINRLVSRGFTDVPDVKPAS